MSVIQPPRDMPERATELGEYAKFSDEDEGEIGMNQNQFEGIVRIVLTAAAAVVGTLGWMHGFDWTPVISLGVSLGVGWWSIHSNNTQTMVATVSDAPEVKAVVMTTKAAANSTPALEARQNVVGPQALK